LTATYVLRIYGLMKLKHLPDKNLLNEMSKLVVQEREVLEKVLWHLREIDQRKLYCEVKCGSLFEYCVKVLKYSEGQASRRVTASRLLKELPEVAKEIKKGEINLTQLNQVKQFFLSEGVTAVEDKMKVIEVIKGKTTRETENILWDLKKEDAPKKMNLTLLEETILELRKIQGMKAHACPNMDVLLMKMCGEVKVIWDPTLVIRKRKVGDGDTRYVPVQVRAEVWERDQGKCRNCGTGYALELDHVRAFAVGGKSTVENLQLLCRACNQRKGVGGFNTDRPHMTIGAFSQT